MVPVRTLTPLLLLLPSLASGAPVHERDSWYIGFGLGGGRAEFTADGSTSSFDDWLDGTSKDPERVFNLKAGC